MAVLRPTDRAVLVAPAARLDTLPEAVKGPVAPAADATRVSLSAVTVAVLPTDTERVAVSPTWTMPKFTAGVLLVATAVV